VTGGQPLVVWKLIPGREQGKRTHISCSVHSLHQSICTHTSCCWGFS